MVSLMKEMKGIHLISFPVNGLMLLKNMKYYRQVVELISIIWMELLILGTLKIVGAVMVLIMTGMDLLILKIQMKRWIQILEESQGLMKKPG